MFARIIKVNLKPNHVADFTAAFEKQILPMLRKETGFQDAISFAGPSGTEIVAVSLWDRKESADSYNVKTYPEVLKALANMLEGTPQVKTYEVTNSSFHKIASPVAV